MNTEFHRHCQKTVLSAYGFGGQGATWDTIASLSLPNLPSGWISYFNENTQNITQDFAAILKLLDEMGAGVKRATDGRTLTLNIGSGRIKFNTVNGKLNSEDEILTTEVVIPGVGLYFSTDKKLNLTPATTTNLGGVKVGRGLKADAKGVLSLNTSLSQSNYLGLSSNGELISSPAPDSVSTMSSTVRGVARAGTGLTMGSDQNIDVLNLRKATTANLGGVIVGSGLEVSEGTVSLKKPSGYSSCEYVGISSTGELKYAPAPQTVSRMSASSLGIAKSGTGLEVDSGGALNLNKATSNSLGGVKVGSGLDIGSDGTVSLKSPGGPSDYVGIDSDGNLVSAAAPTLNVGRLMEQESGKFHVKVDSSLKNDDGTVKSANFVGIGANGQLVESVLPTHTLVSGNCYGSNFIYPHGKPGGYRLSLSASKNSPAQTSGRIQVPNDDGFQTWIVNAHLVQSDIPPWAWVCIYNNPDPEAEGRIEHRVFHSCDEWGNGAGAVAQFEYWFSFFVPKNWYIDLRLEAGSQMAGSVTNVSVHCDFCFCPVYFW